MGVRGFRSNCGRDHVSEPFLAIPEWVPCPWRPRKLLAVQVEPPQPAKSSTRQHMGVLKVPGLGGLMAVLDDTHGLDRLG